MSIIDRGDGAAPIVGVDLDYTLVPLVHTARTDRDVIILGGAKILEQKFTVAAASSNMILVLCGGVKTVFRTGKGYHEAL